MTMSDTGNIPQEIIAEMAEEDREDQACETLQEQCEDSEECLTDAQLQMLGVEEYEEKNDPQWMGTGTAVEMMQRMMLERLNTAAMDETLERLRQENERRALEIARMQSLEANRTLRFGGDPIHEIRGQNADFMVMDELAEYNQRDAELVDRLTEEAVREINNTATTNATPRDEGEGALRLRQIQDIMRALDL